MKTFTTIVLYFQNGQTPLSIAQRLGYVSVVETLKTVTETTVITETTTVTEERYKPQNPERMNETMFSDSEDEVDETQVRVLLTEDSISTISLTFLRPPSRPPPRTTHTTSTKA